MIELVNEKADISVTLIPLSMKIIMRTRLHQTFDKDHQDTIRAIYNDLLAGENSFHYIISNAGRVMAVVAIKDQLTKTIGRIPEEVSAILKKYGIYKPTILNVEVRKHTEYKKDTYSPIFGINVRIRTDLDIGVMPSLTRDFELNIMNKENTDDK